MSNFTVAGVSTQFGITKVRFANDIVSRTKLLAKGGHSPPHLRLSAIAQNGAESSNSRRIGVRDLAALAGLDHFNPAAISA